MSEKWVSNFIHPSIALVQMYVSLTAFKHCLASIDFSDICVS